jgi:very-long-chain ceramide synthase
MGDFSEHAASNGPEVADRGHAGAPSPTPISTSSLPPTAAPTPVRRTVKRDYNSEKETMNGPLYMQASNNVVIVRRVKRKGDSPWKQLIRWFVENQIGTLRSRWSMNIYNDARTRCAARGSYHLVTVYGPSALRNR